MTVSLTFGNILLLTLMIMVAIMFGRLIIVLAIGAISAAFLGIVYGFAYVADRITDLYRTGKRKFQRRAK